MRWVRGAWWSIYLYVFGDRQAPAVGDDNIGAPSMQGLTGLLTMNTADIRGTGFATQPRTTSGKLNTVGLISRS